MYLPALSKRMVESVFDQAHPDRQVRLVRAYKDMYPGRGG